MVRPCILLAWELGGGFGHLAKLQVLAAHLRNRGIDCVWVVRNLDAAARLLPVDATDLLHQAPLAQEAPQHPLALQLNYASTLFSCGYDQPLTLSARLRAWCALMRSSGCTHVIADHAPTAMLAARILGLPCAVPGTGFGLPPVVSPFPGYLPEANPAVMLDNEQKVTGIINQALTKLGAAPLPHLQALFEGCFEGLFTYPETDHYREPRTQRYLGLHDLSRGKSIDWGSPREPRVLAVLEPSPGTDAVLQALATLPAQVLVKIRGLNTSHLAGLQRPGLRITDQAVWLRQAVESCDIFVSHGAHGATVEALLAGKPQLLLPDQRERLMLSQRLTATGAAISLPSADTATYGTALRRLLDDPAPHAAAAAFSSRHAGTPRQRILNDWCDALLAN